MAIIKGKPGDDELVGTTADDTFQLAQLWDFTATGLEGNDRFLFRGGFTANDKINGGAGRDTVVLEGDYSSSVNFAADTMVAVEILSLVGGHDYSLATDDATVGAGETLTIKASGFGAGDNLGFDGSAETDGRFALFTGAGGDDLTGGAGNDLFVLTGGIDSAEGGQGNDVFQLGGSLTTLDAISGGAGTDTAVLQGDYETGDLVLGPSTLVEVEKLNLLAGFDYNITTDDATVAAGERLTVDASKLQAGDVLTFDGTAETGGAFSITGGAGDDLMVGGAGKDIFSLTRGGLDEAQGGTGNDVFRYGAGAAPDDTIDGGDGSDTLSLSGDFSAGVDLGDAIATSIETLQFSADFDYFILSTGDPFVAAGATVTVDASRLGAGDSISFDGTDETDGSWVFIGGDGDDTFGGGDVDDNLAGGDGADSLEGGVGADTLSGGGGADVFFYFGAGTSSSTTHDTVTDFDASLDVFNLEFAVDTVVARSGSISSAFFDDDIGAAFNDGVTDGDAVVITATGGDLAGRTFLAVTQTNGLYDAGSDYVFDITGFTGTITTGNFT
jgi:Ca2+-binding RTX toxin-like protein